MKSAIRTMLGRALIIIIGAVMFFAAVEIALRHYASTHRTHIYVPHPSLFWRLLPNVKSFTQVTPELGGATLTTIISTNSQGLRDEEIPRGAYTILCLGDSSVFGHGVPFEETFEKILQRMLREKYPDKSIYVVNGGVPGYSTFQGLRLMDHCMQYRPSIVVIGYFFSDQAQDIMPDKERASAPFGSGCLQDLLYRSETYLFLRDKLGRGKKTMPARGGAAFCARVSPSDYRANLAEMIARAKAAGASVLLLNMADSRDRQPKEYEGHRRVLRELAAEENIPLVDIDGAFGALKRPKALFVDVIHPSGKGNKVIASEIFKVLTDRDLIK